LKMAKKVVKTTHRTRSESWTKEQARTDDESNVGTLLWKK
jgi:hypothetical protein